MSCGVGHRHGLDLALLWLWCRPVAAAPIGPLDWEHPFAVGAALKRQKTKKKKKKKFAGDYTKTKSLYIPKVNSNLGPLERHKLQALQDALF